MIYSIFPTYDATVYEEFVDQNTGQDSILEISNGLDNNGQSLKYNTRAFVKFDITAISASLASGKITNPKFYLSLYTTEAKEIPLDYTLYAYP